MTQALDVGILLVVGDDDVDDFQRVVIGKAGGKLIGQARMGTGATAHIDIPAFFRADNANVFDDRFGTGVGAAGHADFHA